MRKHTGASLAVLVLILVPRPRCPPGNDDEDEDDEDIDDEDAAGLTSTCIVQTLAEEHARLMKIALASDHAGFEYKEAIHAWLNQRGHVVRDFGAPSNQPVDYPDFIRPAAQAVARGECDRGIVLGGSGNGEAMVANKVRGIRCALCWNEDTARLSRQHNDANVLSLGQRMIPREVALRIVEVWLETPFEGGRHLSRIQKIEPL